MQSFFLREFASASLFLGALAHPQWGSPQACLDFLQNDQECEAV
jgi:hypothetical protein